MSRTNKKVTERDVLQVADLANLELTSQERTRLLADMNSILDYISKLNELDTANVPPMTQGLDKLADASFRADTLGPSLPHDEAMRNAPGTDGNFFKVPKVIEK